jgi:hypothetical protein
VQLQLWVRIFACNRAEEAIVGQGLGASQIARRSNSAPDLPDVSKCFCGIAQASMPMTTMLLCMGLFSIF